jgi:hypothetical protein
MAFSVAISNIREADSHLPRKEHISLVGQGEGVNFVMVHRTHAAILETNYDVTSHKLLSHYTLYIAA